MASFSKRALGWRGQIAIKGVPESKTFSTKAEADNWAAARETETRLPEQCIENAGRKAEKSRARWGRQ